MAYKRHITGNELYHGVRSIYSGEQYDSFFPTNVRTDREVVKKNNTTSDTIELMQHQVEKWNSDTKIIANILKANTLEETLHNIWDFVFFHFQYKQDHHLFEEVRRPARSWADRQNGIDCDCKSVFIASTLKNLRIPAYFRRAAYNNGDYSHVYVIVPKNGKNYNPKNPNTYYAIDAVVSKFNTELNPTKIKDDMSDLAALNGLPMGNLKLQSKKIVTENALDIYKSEAYKVADAALADVLAGENPEFTYVTVTPKSFDEYVLYFESRFIEILKQSLNPQLRTLNGPRWKNFWARCIATVATNVGMGVAGGIGFLIAGPVGAGIAMAGVGAISAFYWKSSVNAIQSSMGNTMSPFQLIKDKNNQNHFQILLPKNWVINYPNKSVLQPSSIGNNSDFDHIRIMAIGGVFYKYFLAAYIHQAKQNKVRGNAYSMNGLNAGPDEPISQTPENLTKEVEKAGGDPSKANQYFKTLSNSVSETGKIEAKNVEKQVLDQIGLFLKKITMDAVIWVGSSVLPNQIEKSRDEYFAKQKQLFIDNKIFFIPQKDLIELQKPLIEIDKKTSSSKADLQANNMFTWLYGDVARYGIPDSRREGGINMIPHIRQEIHEKTLLADTYFYDDRLSKKLQVVTPYGRVFNPGDTVMLIGTYYFQVATVLGKLDSTWFYTNNRGVLSTIYLDAPFYAKNPQIVSGQKHPTVGENREFLTVIPIFDSVKAGKLKNGDYSYIFKKFAPKSVMDEINARKNQLNPQPTIQTTNPITAQTAGMSTEKMAAGIFGLGVGGWLLSKFFGSKPKAKTNSQKLDGYAKKQNSKPKKTSKKILKVTL